MRLNKTLGIFLKQLRLHHDDERLIDMANKLNISQSFLSAIESGKRNLSDKLIFRIVDVYKLNENDEKELFHLRDLALNKINITLENLEDKQKETVVEFLSNVDKMDDKTLKKINLIIKENKNGSEK